VANPAQPRLTGEYVVPLPTFKDAKGKNAVAAQSELVALSDILFLLLCRDSNNGYGLEGDTSLYRRVELLDLSKATNIAGTAYDGGTPVAPKGKLDPAVQPATLTSFIDLNDNTQLGRRRRHHAAGLPRDPARLRGALRRKARGAAPLDMGFSARIDVRARRASTGEGATRGTACSPCYWPAVCAPST